jgi:filamentous hemagglutinin
LAGEQYNRQLHPSEQQLAQTLAANSNGQYTVQQIEDAMRISGYTSTSGSSIPAETTQTGMLVDVTNSRSIYDVNAGWLLSLGQTVPRI